MKIQFTKLITAFSLAIIFGVISGCFTILNIDQPTTAQTGEKITVPIEVRTEATDQNPHYGIVGVLVPNDWQVDSVYYSGDFGPDYCEFLHPDSVDGDIGGKVDYWHDSLEVRYPSGDEMEWRVYQASIPFASALDTGYVDVTIEMTVGQKAGTYKIGYFVTNAALDFTDPSFYAINLENSIEVQGGAAVPLLPNTGGAQFLLRQNYPNPFNPGTTISYELSGSGLTTLEIYNVLGELVATPVHEMQSAGEHQYTWNATGLDSGVYYLRLQAGAQVAINKLVLAK
ncbi:T9SS type A sorting domain-containing protein [candidate division KSB1 bacterium]|nr:T9SS type A sorting domain-containing protein [candidate division KSB1 bacterium]